MRFDFLSQPVSEDAPSGPDLDDAGDGAYLNFVLVAPDRLPTTFIVQTPDGARKPFDRSSIELQKEVDAIAELLKRTRDIRLITLDARFNAAGGDIVGFCEATQGLALVVSTFWDTFHPGAGDMIIRQNTIESLDSPGQITLHLQNARLTGGGRTRPVSLRQYLVATGKAAAREDEEVATLDQISATMTNEANADDLAGVNAALEASREALDAIRQAFAAKAGSEFSLSFDNLYQTYKQMREMIGAFRADLAPPPEDAGAAGDAGTAGSGNKVLLGSVKTHADATKALAAAEAYFLRTEPSNPALILVHQSKMLIGQPLVSALEALMPETAPQAALRFEGGIRFQIDLARMKSVTEDAVSNASTDGYGAGTDTTSAEDWAALESAASEDTSSGWGSSEETPSSDSGGEEGSGAWGSETPPTEGSEGEGGETPPPEPEPPAVAPEPPVPPAPASPFEFRAGTRGEAIDLIQATETFFRTVEPSSPIPTLLSKARTYVSKDFASILSEMMPREQPQ